ncbi:hypothetical protein [Paenibacillus sp. sgz500958]|uniref:hypothetical protein n=1 Tax=Paenibacillus sp. sgz500958 TaxID=3242475 RepID=UPI0036D24BB5
MNNSHFSDIPSVRLSAGMYALSKLACAGLTFLLLTLFLLWQPENGGKPEGWPISLSHAIYGFGLTASLVADALLRLLRGTTLVRSFILYGIIGLAAGLWLAADQGGIGWQCAIGGVVVLLIFRAAEFAAEKAPLLLPVFALMAPLLALLLR